MFKAVLEFMLQTKLQNNPIFTIIDIGMYIMLIMTAIELLIRLITWELDARDKEKEKENGNRENDSNEER